jgi:hypothetical protein
MPKSFSESAFNAYLAHALASMALVARTASLWLLMIAHMPSDRCTRRLENIERVLGTLA